MAGSETIVEGLPSFRVGTLREASSTPQNSLEAGFQVDTLQNGSIAYVLDQAAEYRWIASSLDAPSDPTIIIPLGQNPLVPGRWIQIETGSGSVGLTDHVITSREDLVAVVAPVAGVFTLPAGSYGIKELTLDSGESLAVEDNVRIFSAGSVISASVGVTQIEVLEGGNLILDNVNVSGLLVMSGSINTTWVRMNQSSFSSAAGPILDQSGGSLWAVNSWFQAVSLTACEVSGGVCRMVACELDSDPAASSMLVSGSAVAELTNCNLLGGASVTDTNGSLFLRGGETPRVELADADVAVIEGVVIEGDGTSTGVLIAPVNLVRNVAVKGCTILNHAFGADMQNASLLEAVLFDGNAFDAIATNSIRFAGGPIPVGGSGTAVNNRFTQEVADAFDGFNQGSTRWFARTNSASNGKILETAITV